MSQTLIPDLVELKFLLIHVDGQGFQFKFPPYPHGSRPRMSLPNRSLVGVVQMYQVGVLQLKASCHRSLDWLLPAIQLGSDRGSSFTRVASNTRSACSPPGFESKAYHPLVGFRHGCVQWSKRVSALREVLVPAIQIKRVLRTHLHACECLGVRVVCARTSHVYLKKLDRVRRRKIAFSLIVYQHTQRMKIQSSVSTKI